MMVTAEGFRPQRSGKYSLAMFPNLPALKRIIWAPRNSLCSLGWLRLTTGSYYQLTP